MQRNKKLIVMLSGLLVASAAAANQVGNYTYLSGGVAVDFDNHQYSKNLGKKFSEKSFGILNEDSLRLKKNSVGYYLRGSYAFGDNDSFFTEARLRVLETRKPSYLVGFGYQMAVDDNSSCYVLVGANQPGSPTKNGINRASKKAISEHAFGSLLVKKMMHDNTTLGEIHNTLLTMGMTQADLAQLPLDGMIQNDPLNEDRSIAQACQHQNRVLEQVLAALQGGIDNFCGINDDFFQQVKLFQDQVLQSQLRLKSKIAPAIEVGYRVNLTDELGVKLAYQLRRDTLQLTGKVINTVFNEKKTGLSHEGNVELYYAFNNNWQAEMGYTASRQLKMDKASHTIGHQTNVGLRYTFS